MLLLSCTLASDSIIIDTDKVLDEIIHEEQTTDRDDNEHLNWDRYQQKLDVLDETSLDNIQGVFVRFKGLYEGLYKGFYRNQDLEHREYADECLGYDSYEALDIIAEAWDSHK